MSVDDMLAYSNEKEEKIQKIQALGQEFNQALQSNDNAKIGQILESAKSLDVEIHAVLQINYYAYLGDWSALTEFINKSEVDLKSSVSNIFMSTDQMELDPNLLKAMEKHLVLNLPGGTALLKSRLYVRLGDLKKAEAFASEALSEVKLDGEFPTEPFEGFLQAIKNEQPMTLLDLQEAFNK